MELYMQHISHLQIGLATRRADRKKRQAQQVSVWTLCRMEEISLLC